MSDAPALALSGSNLTDDTPFSCALRLPGGTFEARSPAGGRGDLAALAAGLCAAHAVAPADLRELRIDLGPGSYTGLRVAVTFVRFLQRFGAIPVLAVDSLAVLAASAGSTGTAAMRLRPLLDARRQRYHCGTLGWTPDGRLAHQVEPTAMPLPAVLASVQAHDLFVAPAGVAAAMGEQLRGAGAAIAVATGCTAAALFDERLPLRACTPEQLEPRYLMGSYAED